ncbi:MAG: hypothetical protein SPL17_03300 [Bacteroidales bacterium]|nr:hypothetical protein [Bacteroidales bacterium]
MFKPTVITSEGVNGIRSPGLGGLSLALGCGGVSMAATCGGGATAYHWRLAAAASQWQRPAVVVRLPISSAWLRRRLNGSDLRWWCDCLSLAVGCGGGWEVEGFS